MHIHTYVKLDAFCESEVSNNMLEKRCFCNIDEWLWYLGDRQKEHSSSMAACLDFVSIIKNMHRI